MACVAITKRKRKRSQHTYLSFSRGLCQTKLPMDLARPSEMDPDELPEPGRVVVLQGFSVSEGLKNGVTPHQGLVQMGLLVSGPALFHPTHSSEVLNN